MNAIRSVSLLAFSALMLGLPGACTSHDSALGAGVSGNSGNSGESGSDLNLGQGGGLGEVAGAAGQSMAPSVSDCERFAGLDECGVTSVTATFSAANVLLVIDKSSSMDDQPKGFELKKWDALKAALAPALEAVQDELSFGLLLYPFSKKAEIPLDCFEGCCEVPQGPAALEVDIQPG